LTFSITNTLDIDDGAPVISREEMFIEAPLELVWNLHVDINGWPSWRPDVDGAQLADTFVVGSAFRWQTAGLHITSTITQVVPFSRTTWGGPADGIDGVHVWEFSPRDNGALVRTRESWNGEPVRANASALQSALDESLRVWLRDLRAEAERRHRAP
jgi:uncharacterized protein YndB with AHSA1/START domain